MKWDSMMGWRIERLLLRVQCAAAGKDANGGWIAGARSQIEWSAA